MKLTNREELIFKAEDSYTYGEKMCQVYATLAIVDVMEELVRILSSNQTNIPSSFS